MVYDEARSAVDVRSCRLVVLHAGPWSCDRAVIGWDGTRGKSSLEGRNVTWFDKRNTRRHAISPQSKQTSLSFSSTTACYQRQHHTPTRLPTDAVRRRSSHAFTTHYMRIFSNLVAREVGNFAPPRSMVLHEFTHGRHDNHNPFEQTLTRPRNAFWYAESHSSRAVKSLDVV